MGFFTGVPRPMKYADPTLGRGENSLGIPKGLKPKPYKEQE